MKTKNKKIIADDKYKTVTIEEIKGDKIDTIKIVVWDKARKRSTRIKINTFYEKCIEGVSVETDY